VQGGKGQKKQKEKRKNLGIPAFVFLGGGGRIKGGGLVGNQRFKGRGGEEEGRISIVLNFTWKRKGKERSGRLPKGGDRHKKEKENDQPNQQEKEKERGKCVFQTKKPRKITGGQKEGKREKTPRHKVPTSPAGEKKGKKEGEGRM